MGVDYFSGHVLGHRAAMGHRSRGRKAQTESQDSWTWLGVPRPAMRLGPSGSQAPEKPGVAGEWSGGSQARSSPGPGGVTGKRGELRIVRWGESLA